MSHSRWLLLQATITLMVSSMRLRPDRQPPADLLLPPANPHRRLLTSAHHPPVTDESKWSTWQPGITRAFTAAEAGYKGQLAGSHFGHDIASKMSHSRWLLLQATITLMVSSMRLRPDRQPPADLLLPPANPHRRLLTSAHHPPVTDESKWSTWQPGITRAFTAAEAGYKGQLAGSHFGHDIASKMSHSRWLLLQLVEYLQKQVAFSPPSLHCHVRPGDLESPFCMDSTMMMTSQVMRALLKAAATTTHTGDDVHFSGRLAALLRLGHVNTQAMFEWDPAKTSCIYKGSCTFAHNYNNWERTMGQRALWNLVLWHRRLYAGDKVELSARLDARDYRNMFEEIKNYLQRPYDEDDNTEKSAPSSDKRFAHSRL
ncbi:uncharacterized protein [Dermacentor albipictus]|uniref:uncharacterized protein isoform X2 n=1 Tax=Dermacentor albipictus TaxID=60249 RepID=UPI0031FCA6E5